MSPEEIQRERARRHLLPYVSYTMPNYRANWHHEVVATEFEAFVRGDITRLMILMPPRHGKTELVSRRGPAWAMGNNPDLQIISATYAADFASNITRNVQRIMASPEHSNVFPLGQMASVEVGKSRSVKRFDMASGSGHYIGASTNSPITGQGMNLGIIDDPVKGWEQAYSQAYRDRNWEWYGSDFLTRGEGDFGVCLTFTPWHEDDLGGRLLRTEGHLWRVVRLPAILDGKPGPFDRRKPGEALWEANFPLERLYRIKGGTIDGVDYGHGVGSAAWEGLYQGRPTPPGGNMVKTKWWNYWKELPPRTDQIMWVISADLNAGEETEDGSNVVIQIWMVAKGERFYLIDQRLGPWEFTRTIRELERARQEYPQATTMLIEKKAAGTAAINVLRRRMGGIIPVVPEGSKIARLQGCVGRIEAGDIYLPENAQWLGEFKSELGSFPKGLRDDQVDTLTQFLNWVEANSGLALISDLTQW